MPKKFRPDQLMAFFVSGAIIANIFMIVMKTSETTYALLAVRFFLEVFFSPLCLPWVQQI